jgi:prepilin-type N-terminal cleavage/methylation domain-containing protein
MTAISQLVTRLRRRLEEEGGFTLIELLVAMSLLTIVMVIFLSALLGAQTTISRASARSASNDQARLAVEELDREIRSGNVLYDPSNCPPPPVTPTGPPTCDVVNGITPGMSLLVYTQTNANSRNPGNQCVQWRITPVDSTGVSQLQRRDWSVNWQTDGIVDGWRDIADDIVNRQPPGGGTQQAAFALDPALAYGGRVVEITLLTNGDPANSESQTVTTETEVTGRNTEYGYPSNICSTIPPY